MQPGPNYIYKTPITGALVKVSSICSGNTFGATFWTDGWHEAPMLPDEPWLQLHPITNELFWTDECEKIDSELPWESNEKYVDVPFAATPTLKNYQTVLASGFASTPKKERYIRLRYWWAANDPVRHEEQNASFPPDHRENLQKLRALLRKSDPNQRLMAAEISRELGDFDKATDLLNFPFPEKYAHSVERISALIEERDVRVREVI